MGELVAQQTRPETHGRRQVGGSGRRRFQCGSRGQNKGSPLRTASSIRGFAVATTAQAHNVVGVGGTEMSGGGGRLPSSQATPRRRHCGGPSLHAGRRPTQQVCACGVADVALRTAWSTNSGPLAGARPARVGLALAPAGRASPPCAGANEWSGSISRSRILPERRARSDAVAGSGWHRSVG